MPRTRNDYRRLTLDLPAKPKSETPKEFHRIMNGLCTHWFINKGDDMTAELTKSSVMKLGKKFERSIMEHMPLEEALSYYKTEEVFKQYKPEEILNLFKPEELEAHLKKVKKNSRRK